MIKAGVELMRWGQRPCSSAVQAIWAACPRMLLASACLRRRGRSRALEQLRADLCDTVSAAQLGGKPDLIIGNYSDGNLVSSLLSHHLNTTQCTIAHALEKTKYPVRGVAGVATSKLLSSPVPCCPAHDFLWP